MSEGSSTIYRAERTTEHTSQFQQWLEDARTDRNLRERAPHFEYAIRDFNPDLRQYARDEFDALCAPSQDVLEDLLTNESARTALALHLMRSYSPAEKEQNIWMPPY